MLPSYLKSVRKKLKKLGASRSADQDELFAELKLIDDALDAAKHKDEDLTEGIEKRIASIPSVLGPTPGRCPTCGGPW